MKLNKTILEGIFEHIQYITFKDGTILNNPTLQSLEEHFKSVYDIYHENRKGGVKWVN